jgi:uncharacterized protein YggU (UPF0235/DUF167 family)
LAGGHLRLAKGGVELFVRLTPRAARDEIGSVEATADGREHLAARVRAVAEKGKANAALERLVADWLGVPRSTVRIHAGATQRLKILRIEGDAKAVAANIEKLTS